MALKPCDWKRFWHPREVRPHLGGDGFVYDPESEFGRAANSHLVRFEAIRDVPCLVLLGDPGMGKSFTVRELAEQSTSDRQVLLLDLLRDCGSDALLCRNLLDAEWFKEWKEASDGQLELFLDSLDECRVRFQIIAAVLARELKALPRERLKLRVVSRSAEWPEDFGNQLGELWSTKGFAIYEMAPLRRDDVAAAARAYGIDVDQFVAQVIERGVQAFAARPITLELLINIFKRQGQLPTRLVELYECGLPLLCEETPGRLQVNLRARLSGRQQVAVASRIAAGLVLGGGLAVRSTVDRGDLETGEVLVSDLTGHAEPSDGAEVQVDEAAVVETIRSGLFSFGGPERRTFAHQTYKEFLVARYLHRAGFSKKQIYNLISVPDERELTVAPQLEEICAWLASMEAEVFQDILGHQPEILVRGDIATIDPGVRHALVDALLTRVNAHAIEDWFQLFRHLKKLDHPTISDQLRGGSVILMCRKFARQPLTLHARAPVRISATNWPRLLSTNRSRWSSASARRLRLRTWEHLLRGRCSRRWREARRAMTRETNLADMACKPSGPTSFQQKSSSTALPDRKTTTSTAAIDSSSTILTSPRRYNPTTCPLPFDGSTGGRSAATLPMTFAAVPTESCSTPGSNVAVSTSAKRWPQCFGTASVSTTTISRSEIVRRHRC